MSLGNTSRVSIKFKPEATLGTTPGTGNYYNLRFTDEAFKNAIKMAKSMEIRSDRQVPDLIPVDADMAGGNGGEFSYGEFDSLLDGLLQGAWGQSIGTNGAATGTATFTSTSVALAGAGTPFSSVSSGQWFRVTGAAQAGNNAWRQVQSQTAGTMITISTTVSSAFTAETGTTGVQVQGSRLTNGTTLKSYSIERRNEDLNVFSIFRGMCPNKATFKMSPGQILDLNFDWMGMTSVSTTTSMMPGTNNASLTNSIWNATANFFGLLENGAALANTFVRSLTLELNNNLRGQKAVGVMGNAGIGSGVFEVTGTVELYFADLTMYNKFLNNTQSSISVQLANAANGIGYRFTVPALKYSDGGFPTPGLNQDVTLSMPFQGIRDSVTGSTLIIDRCGDAVTPWA